MIVNLVIGGIFFSIIAFGAYKTIKGFKSNTCPGCSGCSSKEKCRCQPHDI